jgi:3-dehydroquinate synthase
MAGFAAATYMRGVDWLPVPTTLLAMVDSSIGGKVGINHPRAKNLIGAFHQPRAVVADVSFLDTLPAREGQSGAYEVLKCGVIGDASLFASLESAPAGTLGATPARVAAAVGAACRLKAEVVSADEREGGLRRVLNLGHTLGHAFEAVTRYRRFTHGEAVGWGMIAAAVLARDLGRLDASDFLRIAAAVDRLGRRPPVRDLPAREVLDAVARDKKARGGKVPFVLPVAVGQVVVEPEVPRAAVRRALRELARRGTGGP